jgi:DNA repair protein RadC
MHTVEPYTIDGVTPLQVRRSRGGRRQLRKMLRLMEGVNDGEVANALIDRFGSVRGVLSATTQEQMLIVSDKRIVHFLRVVRQSMRWTLREGVVGSVLLSSTAALREYLKLSHGSDSFEQLRVFYLGATGRLIKEVPSERGGSDHTNVSVSRIIRDGLNLDARYLIMSHNHPSGDSKPSRDDIDVTRRIAIAANSVGMSLYDHLIVAETSDFSFRENGRL